MLTLILLQAEETPDFILFLGRFHPLIVHLPIGFLSIAAAFEFLSRKEKYKNLAFATAVSLFFTAVSSIIAALLGYFLSLSGGYDEGTLALHKWFGIALAVGSTLAWLFKIRHQKQTSTLSERVYTFFLLLAVFFLIGTGHVGGSLTHGSDYLTSYMPDPLRKIGGLPSKHKIGIRPIKNIPQAVVYTDIIQPVLNDRCISCHGSSKQKGDLRLDDKEHILKGGEDGKILIPGEPRKSKLYTYLLLPEGDDKHMPPKGKVQLTKEQIKIVSWWIGEGASFDKKVSQLKVPDTIKNALAKFSEGGGENKLQGIFAKKVGEVDEKKIAELNSKGFKVVKIAADVNYVQVSLAVDKTSFSENDAKALQGINDQVAWLDLNGKKLASGSMDGLDKFPNLARIHLQNSTVTDDMLKPLGGLKNLEFLNLYGTSITDVGLSILASSKNLRVLYLWQTKISEKGIAAFRAKNKKVVINNGEKPRPIDTMFKDTIKRL